MSIRLNVIIQQSFRTSINFHFREISKKFK